MPIPRSRSLARTLLALCAGLGAVGCERVESALIARVAERAATTPDHVEWLEDGALHVVLCGTGSPLPSADRAGPCTAIFAGGHFLLIDVGPGANDQMGLLRLPRQEIDAVLLTHFHSDHIGELGELAMQSWALGRARPLPVYGPPGVEEVVAGFEAAYAHDTGYRVAHHGADWMPPSARPLQAQPVALDAAGSTAGSAVVFEEEDGLRVTAFAVDHAPVAPAYGYRIDFAGRSVVVSGDTLPSANLAAHARGADLLLHEALAAHLVEAAREALSAAGNERRARIAHDIQGYHTTPVQAAETAKQAGVSLLVLHHLVPPPPNAFVRRLFLRGVAEAWDGEVVLGEDGMHFALPPGSDTIQRESL
jgi:ribonuclease Z